jgi:hypothetical protein
MANAQLQWYSRFFFELDERRITKRSPSSTTELRSSLYPTLNPVLAIDSSPLRYNLRKKPRTEIFTSQYYAYLQFAATTTYATQMRLISKAFPWSVDIKTTPYITCEKVWEALHLALHEEVEDSEWGLIVTDEDSRRRVLKAARKRWDGSKESGPHVLKRIDFLGERTVFVGLEKNEEFEKERQLPGEPLGSAETWVVKLGSP